MLTVIATDADNGNNGSVTYSLKQVPMKAGQPLFAVDSHMGLITTRLTNALDREVQPITVSPRDGQAELTDTQHREVQPIYHVIVLARDRGSPPLSGRSERISYSR